MIPRSVFLSLQETPHGAKRVRGGGHFVIIPGLSAIALVQRAAFRLGVARVGCCSAVVAVGISTGRVVIGGLEECNDLRWREARIH